MVLGLCRRQGTVAGAGCGPWCRRRRLRLAGLGIGVGVAVGAAFHESVAAHAREVIAHLVGSVAGAEQIIHPGTHAPVGGSEGS